MITDEIIDKINKGPMVLFLGQKYLSIKNDKDPLLSKISVKYSKSENAEGFDNYDIIPKLNMLSEYESVSSWIDNLCKVISVPTWLEKIARLSWSHIYTSAIDTIVSRAFTSEWRQVQPVYDERFKILDPRNKFNLHVTYLYGCISQLEPSKRPPFTLAEKIRRKYTSNTLIQKLPEILTPKGLIVIEGYHTDQDWQNFEDLFATLSRLNTSQAIICSVSEENLQNELIQDLILSKKLLAFKQSFADIVNDLETSGRLTVAIPEPEDYLGKWLSIGEHKIKIPQELISSIAKTATIIHDGLFYANEYANPDEKYKSFKEFLASTNTDPNWSGYPSGFAFKRDYHEDLKLKVINKFSSISDKEVPIILHGQSSSGKTVSLGYLAYDLAQQNKVPVLFIEKRYQKIDEKDIDTFCRWAEENKAKFTVVIWDGMADPDLYYSLLRKLNTRGRNIVLIGSTYSGNRIPTTLTNYVESPINLSQEERKRFVSFLKGIDVALGNILSDVDEQNLLAMLYRYLPSSRTLIRRGLKAELEFFSKLIRETENNETASDRGSLGEALIATGLLNSEQVQALDSSRFFHGEEVNLADQILNTIMVPGQFALNVPYELLIRTIGYETMSSQLFKSLAEVNLITWHEDIQGNMMLGPRTAIEAKILINYLGSINAQVEYIKLLLIEIKSFDFATFGYESNPEIQFAVELLNNISPNTTPKFVDFLYDITQVLKDLRENHLAYHPRLILKEASFLRELVKSETKTPEGPFVLLERAELIVRDALERLHDFKERTIHTFLRVELASILGTKIKEFGKEKRHNEEAKDTYLLLKEVNNYAFASNPENYNALDVLAWTTDHLISNNILDREERIEAEAEMLNLFEMAEVEGISEQNKDKYLTRKLKFFELVEKQVLADDVFEELRKKGSASGYYIRAKMILYDNNINEELQEGISMRNSSAFEYLNKHFEKIKSDGKCLFLLLRSWWVMKTNSQLFSQEKQAIPFSKEDWHFCYRVVELLLFLGDQYQSATTYYLRALCEFHIGQINTSLETFRFLDIETDFSSYGRRRIVKSYLASTEDGIPKIYSGEVKRTVAYNKNDKGGELYVSELKNFIPFILNDFGKNMFQEGEVISRFYIGFNFRGPIAVPVKL